MSASFRLNDDVTLGSVLAKAGEGTIYEIVGSPHWVAKIFHPGSPNAADKRDKIAAMIGARPPSAGQADGFVVLTWPLHLIEEPGTVGYVMPRIDTSHAVEIHTVSNPANRANPLPSAPQWTRFATWSHLVNVAANLCLAVDAVHQVDAVIGDFQERNILVSDTTRVTLVDCDSMQFTDAAGRQFLCAVGRPEFTAPELAGQNLAVTPRQRPSDLFALAVHIHLLLMAGNHPFQRGDWTGAGEQPDALTLARSGDWAGGPGSRLHSHPLAPSPDFLPDDVRQLFVRAFTDGVRDPDLRPSAAEWRQVLQSIQFGECPRAHQIPLGTEQCPWCEIEDERGRRKSDRARLCAVTTEQTIYRIDGQSTPAYSSPLPAYSAPATAYGAPQPPYPATIAGQPMAGQQPPVWQRPAVIIGAAAAVVAAIVIGIIVAVSDSSGSSTASTSTYSADDTWTSRTPTVPTRTGPPADAMECDALPGTYGHAARGTTITSCPFAINVRNAVRASNGQFPQTLQVYSPVTQQQYAMSCAVEQVLTCRGGNNAVVYVY
ncbi:putative secreted protein [Mycobacteroides abscessus subsp. abscessus]|nr:putative secreted protein [Mycobacteroides abscessus subsp. abscessus]